MKKLIKLGSVALCFALVIITLAACGEKAASIGINHVDVYTYAGNILSPKLTATGTNKVTEVNGIVTVDAASDVTEIEFDLAKFFEANPGYKGTGFYFTRNDVLKGDNTLVKGSAWYQVGGDAGNRLYKKLGYENNDEMEALTKEAIAALTNREGEVRMYFITSGTQAGKCVVYLDPTTGSSVINGETRVTFMLHGHNGKKAQLKVLVNKAAE